MSRAVSIVIPALDDFDLFERSMPRLLAELERRGQDDEVLIVDDTGEDRIGERLRERFPGTCVVAREENGGFAQALRSGIEAARHELCFSMNPDVVVRAGFLEPLITALDDPETAAAVPKVLLNGEEELIESLVTLELVQGTLKLDQPGLEKGGGPGPTTNSNVAFAVGGTCLLRKREFLEGEGFDSAYEPFYWEDVEWCWSRWRLGHKSVYVPASVVEHHHRGTIGRRVRRELVRAALEKNRLIFHWKHIDDPALLEEHVAALYSLALEAWLEERREDLIWLNLALEQVDEVLASRAKLPPSKLTFAEVHAQARPNPLEPETLGKSEADSAPTSQARKTRKKSTRRKPK